MAAGAIVCAATLLGFAGQFWWVCDLFSHFRVQYFLALSLLVFLALLGRQFGASVVLGLGAGINLACIVPSYLPTSDVTRGDANVLRVISVNINTANQHYDLVQQLIRERDPDVILLMEVSAAWMDALDELHSAYPYRKVEPRDDNFGVALFSKRAFTTCDTVYFGPAGVPSFVGKLDVAGQQLTLVGTHLLPPISARYAAFRDSQLEAVADYLTSVSGPKILLGDLNTSPWSHSFWRLTSVLIDAAVPAGYYAPNSGGTPELAYEHLKQLTGGKVDIWMYAWVPTTTEDFRSGLERARKLGAKQILYWEADYIDNNPQKTDLQKVMSDHAAPPTNRYMQRTP